MRFDSSCDSPVRALCAAMGRRLAVFPGSCSYAFEEGAVGPHVRAGDGSGRKDTPNACVSFSRLRPRLPIAPQSRDLVVGEHARRPVGEVVHDLVTLLFMAILRSARCCSGAPEATGPYGF